MKPAGVVAAIGLVMGLSACARTLPDQDRRIHGAVPVAKLSADILATEYAADPAAADQRYWGNALEVTGVVTAIRVEDTRSVLVFGQETGPEVRAELLDDEAEAIAANATVGRRITLRCYCAGLDESVRLKSCVWPAP